MHTDQEAQLDLQLPTELCMLWNVDKTHTTTYQLQANGVVERSHRILGDSLRVLLLRRGQDEWEELLLQLVRAYRGTLHFANGETANHLKSGKERRLPDQL